MDDDEMKRQSALLESLEGNEAFLLWRSSIVDPELATLKALLSRSDDMGEAQLRSHVKLQYLVEDLFYRVFERVRYANQAERESDNK